MREKTKQIHQFILDNVGEHPKDITAVTAKHFDISRQAVNKHLNVLVDNNKLETKGDRNKREYINVLDYMFVKQYRLSDVDESLIYVKDIYPLIEKYPKNVIEVAEYVFTEMVNNAKDHSEGKVVDIRYIENSSYIIFHIHDDGVGIFKKIKNALGLADEKLAILELAKGKFTTDPKNHSGEGIFFSVKASDAFIIKSGDTSFIHFPPVNEKDFLMDSNNRSGTFISFAVKKASKVKLTDVFDEFTDDEYGFTKTVVKLELLRVGNENLISRSQAKRLIARFEKFKQVFLDFQHIETIGQAFADEVFRVFQNRYPAIELIPINTTPDVDKMIKRTKARADEINNS